jgi:two-component system, LuxR family, sensor kinase FixL
VSVSWRKENGVVEGGDETQDMTAELDLANRALADGRSLWAAVLSTVPDALVVIDDKGIMMSFSQAAQRLFGYSERDTVGKNVSMLMPSPHAEAHDTYLARYLQTGEKRIIGTGRVVEGQRSDGTTFPMELYIGEAEAEGHRVFTGFVRDLSERLETDARLQELQSELAHASRLSAMGTLASSLAHELNQPLTAIANYMAASRDMLDALPEKERVAVQEALEESANEAIRAGKIVRRLRDFVSKREVEREVIPMGKLIGDATTLGLVGARENGISWSIDIDDAGDVLADRVQIQQVLVNLMRNAIEAMADSDAKILTIRARNISDRQAEIAVGDTGSGLSPEVAGHLFQPFITTKAHGMGLGLSICRTIVEAHGGQMQAEPGPGGGTIFRFTLNRANDEEPVDEP